MVDGPKDEAAIQFEVHLTDLPDWRLFVWEATDLIAEMRANEHYRYADRLERAIRRLTETTTGDPP